MKESQNFWDRNAERYDRFMRKDAAAYAQLYELLYPVVRRKTVLELATGTGLIAKNIVSSAAHIEATDASPEMILEAKRYNHSAKLHFSVQDMFHLPYVESLTDYYEKAQMTPLMKWFCRQSGKSKFTPKDIARMKATADRKAADRNPYSWNMDFYEYPDGSGYEGRFTKCGICTLMKELGLYDLTPAMCHLDYAMSEAGGVTNFVRQYTLASGGPYCDCGYKKKQL